MVVCGLLKPHVRDLSSNDGMSLRFVSVRVRETRHSILDMALTESQVSSHHTARREI